MKKQTVLKKRYAFLALFTCIAMLLSVFCLSSCEMSDLGLDDEEETEDINKDDDAKGSGEQDVTPDNGSDSNGGDTNDVDSSDGDTNDVDSRVSVVRIKRGAFAGTQLTEDNFEVVKVPISGVPTEAIRSLDEVVGKYATVNVFLGEYVFPRMISDVKPAEEPDFLEYVVVTDEIDVADGKDITKELQALIDKYPGRTIYFDDGVYNITSSLKISSEPDKAVSLRLSNYAIIRALPTFTGEGAMISVGVDSDVTKAVGAENTVMGGIIDGAGVASLGISLENCVKPLISNVTFKNLKTSLWAKATADSVNVESVTVNGNAAEGSIGILIESSRGVVSTSYIANVDIALKNSGSYNDFRNVSAFAKIGSKATCGFFENGDHNVFELCTAQDFTTGYVIAKSASSVFEACNAYWSSANCAKQTAFASEETFNSIISGCTARFFDASSVNAYITFNTKGSGVVKLPIFNESLCDDTSYKSVLADSVIPLS